jgi:hypothetical protein
LGFDTKQERVIQKAPTLTIPEMLRRQHGYFKDQFDDVMNPLRRKFSAVRYSTANAAGRAASAVGSAVRDLPGAARRVSAFAKSLGASQRSP